MTQLFTTKNVSQNTTNLKQKPSNLKKMMKFSLNTIRYKTQHRNQHLNVFGGDVNVFVFWQVEGTLSTLV